MRPPEEKRTARMLRQLARAISRRPGIFLWPQLALFALSVGYAVTHLQFSTTRADLVSETVKYQQDYHAYKREFQLPDALVAVVESESLEKNRRFVERLAQKLEEEPELFRQTYYKGDLRMMGRKGLLFLPEETLEELRQVIQAEWPFIEAFSEARTLNDVFRMVNREFREGPGEISTEEMDRLLPALGVLERLLEEAAESVQNGLPNSFPGLAALFGEQTRLYLTFGGGQIYALVTHAASPGVEERAVRRLRELVNQTRDEISGVNAGISGEPVLNLDEMTQARRDISVAAVMSTLLVALIFIYGFHEIRRPVLATLCLMAGVAYALAFATSSVGQLNILSITLLPILIGLAIDFGVHLISRFEEELREGSDADGALGQALAFTGVGILTSGLTTAGAFLAMMLTDFKGIQEMGLIAGAGLLLCLLAMLTLLPALLVRVRGSAPIRANWENWGARKWLERVLWRSPGFVVLGAALLTAGALTQFPRLSFDYNLLNLQSADLPAVGIEEKLIRSGSESLLHGVVIAESLEQARGMEEQIERLAPVAKVNSLVDFLTEEQGPKLRIIREIKERIAELDLPAPSVEPVDFAALNETLFAMQGYLGLALQDMAQKPEFADAAQKVASLREAVAELRSWLATETELEVARLTEFQRLMFGNLSETIEIIRQQDATSRIELSDVPPFLRERFISPRGRFLLEVHPKKDLWERQNQQEFVSALRQVDPDVTGTLVQVFEYTSLIKDNFLNASAYAAGIIALLLLIHFRRLMPMMLAFLPVLLGLCWTLGLMGLLAIPFNPVSIMAVTLLIGIGVPNGIHILQRFAEEPRPGIIGRSTGKAVLVSGFTTVAGFGSLLVAKHQGIASLGQVMALGTLMCLLASLVVLPCLLMFFNRIRLFEIRAPNRGERKESTGNRANDRPGT